MKIFNAFVFCLFTTLILSQNISGKITYVVSMESYSKEKIDSISKNLKTKKVKMDKWMRDIFENTPNVNAYLVFSNEESLYYAENKMENDGKKTFNMNRVFAGGDDKYYKNIETTDYFRQSSTFGELELIEILPKKWKITQESKKIGKYICFKAIDIESTNKKMKPVVWFTPEVPVGFGPKEFNGLPGLVLLVEMSRNTISASAIKLNSKKEVVITKPKKGKRITAQASEERAKKMWESIKKQ